MSIIKEKKIKRWILNFGLYLSFCFAGWYSARSTVASYVGNMGATYAFLNNDAFAFLIAGVVPIIIYLLVVKFFVYSLRRTPYLPIDDMIYALPYFYFAANIVTGLISIIYYFVPLASFWGNIIVPIISTAGFYALYLWYICKNYIKNYNWKAIVMYFGRLYIFITLFLTVLGLLTAVI